MYKPFLQYASLLGALSVALGAFAAHGLKKVANDQAISIFETAVKYQFYHVFALALSGILYQYFPNKIILSAGYLFMVGVALFSGSLYLLTYFKITNLAQYFWVGAVTPFGGLSLIMGWICLFLGLKK